VTTAADEAPAASRLSLTAAPNPFNPATTISYTVPVEGRLKVAIYDVRGARVATLVDGMHQPGSFSVQWNGRSASGAVVSSGVYFARVTQGEGVVTEKLTLLK
jgi:flagellar hook assembly protein FlgD